MKRLILTLSIMTAAPALAQPIMIVPATDFPTEAGK